MKKVKPSIEKIEIDNKAEKKAVPSKEKDIVVPKKETKKPAPKKAAVKKDKQPVVSDKEIIAAPAVEEKKEVKSKPPTPKKIKKAAPKLASKVKIILELQYHTELGQSIWITSTGLLLGDSVLKQLNYHDNDHWRIELEVETAKIQSDIAYRYHIKYADGHIQDDYEEKIITLKQLKFPFLFIRDFWSYAGYHENLYYKKPFDFLIQRDLTQKNPELTLTTTHLFQVKVAYLKPNEGVCIVGTNAKLGNWDITQFQKLIYDPIQRNWKAGFNIIGEASELEYKYGIYNKENNQLITLEKGANRSTFPLYQKGLVVQNDGFIHLDEKGWKGAGLNIPLFSIRSEKDFGIGDFGSVKLIIDWMSKVGLKLLQLLPINDTTATGTWQDSYPYSAISVFAINPIYMDLEALLTEEDRNVKAIQELISQKEKLHTLAQVDYEAVFELKWQLIELIFQRRKKTILTNKDYKSFITQNEYWLKAYAAFSALRDQYQYAPFEQWENATQYSEEVFENVLKNKKDRIHLYFFVQYILSQQLQEVVQYAHQHNIVLKGDIPIGVNRYSVDTWQHPQYFNTEKQAGAPPDFFTKEGQNWGFPTYQWDVMEKDNYAWWVSRLSNMAQYFDAIRIDHILGFFRIWSIPQEQVQGILGYFQPAIPIEESEFVTWNIPFNYERYCTPFINATILGEIFGDKVDYVTGTFLQPNELGGYSFKPEYDTQKKLKALFDTYEHNDHNTWLLKSLMSLVANVLLLPDTVHPHQYHCRFALEETSSYQYLSAWEQKQLHYLYINYFFERQEDYWKKIGYHQLSAISAATDMMICGEDLGMVPKVVPQIMEQLGILGLRVQRMASDLNSEFTNPATVGFANVVTPSTHDMPPIRNWWNNEFPVIKEAFYKTQLHDSGLVPVIIDETLVCQIIFDHLQSPALWSVFLIQDILAMDNATANPNLVEDIINRPEIAHFYWRYRMHLSVENLLNQEVLNGKIKNFLQLSNR